MDDEKLPPNWIKRRSKRRNVPYYYNTSTKKSVWIHPTKMGVLESESNTTQQPSIPPVLVPSISANTNLEKSRKTEGKQPDQHKTSIKPSERALGVKFKPATARSSLLAIQANSHEIRRTPAQSRLNRLQAQLALERDEKDKLRLTVNQAVSTSDCVVSPKPSTIIQNTNRESLSPETGQRPLEPAAALSTPILKSSLNAKRLLEPQIESPQPPSKRLKVSEKTCSLVQKEPISTTPGLFSFAKNVFRYVANSLSGATDTASHASLKNQPSLDGSSAPCVSQSNDEETLTKPLITNNEPEFKIKAIKGFSHNFNNHFNPDPTFSLQSPLSSNHSPSASPAISSPTAANDRLAKLRQNLAVQQTNNHQIPQSTTIAKSPPLDDDQTMLTDDEDTVHSNITNDSDDDSMDWFESYDPNLAQNVPTPVANPQPGITFVLDTNILIHQLPLVRSLADATFEYLGRPAHLMVPYVVLQELDGQKQRKSNPVSSLAQSAIKYIHERLKAKEKRFQGQAAKSNSYDPRIEIATNDDRILNCALQCQDHSREVVLLSNDVNLRNLALMNVLGAWSAAEMKLWLVKHSDKN